MHHVDVTKYAYIYDEECPKGVNRNAPIAVMFGGMGWLLLSTLKQMSHIRIWLRLTKMSEDRRRNCRISGKLIIPCNTILSSFSRAPSLFNVNFYSLT